jgi:uncharacterized membrane protein YkvA (DUF1232 family)
MTNNSTDKKKGFSFKEIINQGKLAWNLFRDPNVSPLVRFGIPLIGLVYIISPIDIIPDVIPVLGQMDDVAVIMLLTQLFISLAPDNIVAMYRQATQAAQAAGFKPDADAASPSPSAGDDVIDTEYQVVS